MYACAFRYVKHVFGCILQFELLGGVVLVAARAAGGQTKLGRCARDPESTGQGTPEQPNQTPQMLTWL